MGTTWSDVAAEMAIVELHDEAVMKRAALEQAIYVFVEGESEETALTILLTGRLNLGKIGAKIANYNGHGNLSAALRLLNLTLSHNRPIIVTYDNDPASTKSIKKCQQQGLLNNQTYLFPMPTHPIVKYSSGHRGGSFEECFPVKTFLDAAFSSETLPTSASEYRTKFESEFDPCEPWLRQLKEFTAGIGFTGWSVRKLLLAKTLATMCDKLPSTFMELADLIQDVRTNYPVVHPDDVELPKIPGLTAPSERLP